MYQSVNFSTFCDSFSDTYKNNFSYDGKRALFDYLENLEDGTGEKIELKKRNEEKAKLVSEEELIKFFASAK